jgi:predicted amidophosphoribosyltransferase
MPAGACAIHLSQSSLKWKERHKNVRDAFHCDVDLTGKRIALVDVVMTTGSSLNSLAKMF